MQTYPYLNFDGTCAEAFRFYRDTIGGELQLISNEEMPMGPEWKDRTIHASLNLGKTMLMASDSPPGRHVPAAGMHVSLSVEAAEEAERIFAAFADGGTVVMPMAATEWSPGFGMVVDRWGTPWMVNCEPTG